LLAAAAVAVAAGNFETAAYNFFAVT